MRWSALRSSPAVAASLMAATALQAVCLTAGVQARQLFDAVEVDQARFVVVAVPVGSSGTKAQLQIYEQIDPRRRACFETSGSNPVAVAPLLGTFDFTGICRRYIDSQGYSVRVGSEDLGSGYRFVVRKVGADNLLMAAPAGGAGGKPEMLVGRTNGTAGPTAFLAFTLEPGWRVMRRAYGGRALGHVYLYREGWPGDAQTGTAPSPEAPTATSSRDSQASAQVPPVPPLR